MRTSLASASDTGLTRQRNEDAVLAVTWQGRDAAPDAVGFLAVADGMGGTTGGQIASSIAIATAERILRERFESNGITEPADWFTGLDEAFATAAVQLQERAAQAPELRQMGTTLTCMVIHGGRIIVGHVGDSRAYLFRAHLLRRLTTDHNAAAELVSEGRLTPSEAGTHKSRFVLTRWLAADASSPADPECGALAVEHGDVLLVCSDGLYSMLSDDEIAATLNRLPLAVDADLAAAAALLVARANEQGGRDNISVALGAWSRS
jgi:protein phosphatase